MPVGSLIAVGHLLPRLLTSVSHTKSLPVGFVDAGGVTIFQGAENDQMWSRCLQSDLDSTKLSAWPKPNADHIGPPQSLSFYFAHEMTTFEAE